MAIEEQGIKFTLDAASFQANIAQLEKSTTNYKALIDELSAAYARGDVSSEQFAKSLGEYNRDLAKQTQLLEAMKGAQAAETAAVEAATLAEKQRAAALDLTRINLEGTARSTEKAGGAGKDYSQSIRGLSYTMNDFFAVSGGLDQRLNAIANNLPMLLSGFGNLGLILSGVVPVISMVYKNWDSLVGMFEEQHAIPKAADDLAGITKELDSAKDGMKELEKNSSLTITQLEAYNKLRARTAVLEKEVADQQQRQKDLEALKNLKTEHTADDEANAKKTLNATLAGHQDEVVAEMAKGLRVGASAAVTRLTSQANTQSPGSDEQKATLAELSRMQKRAGFTSEAREANEAEARAVLAKAATGNIPALEKTDRMLSQAGTSEAETLRKNRIRPALPEEQKKTIADQEEEAYRVDVAERERKIDEAQREIDDKALANARTRMAQLNKEDEQLAAANKKDADKKKKDELRADTVSRAQDEKHAKALATEYSKHSDVDEQAGALAAQLRAAGVMPPAIQRAFIQRAVVEYLTGLNVSPRNAMAAAGPIARTAAGAEADEADGAGGARRDGNLNSKIPPNLLLYETRGPKKGVRRLQKHTTRKQGVTSRKHRTGPVRLKEGQHQAGADDQGDENPLLAVARAQEQSRKLAAKAKLDKARDEQDAAQRARQARTAQGMGKATAWRKGKFRDPIASSGANAAAGALGVAKEGHAATSATLDGMEAILRQQEQQQARDQANASRAQQLRDRALRLRR